MAYSTDGGRSWEKYDENPIIPNIVGQNRDPKVVQHGPSGSWTMALYLERVGDEQRYGLFTSRDLKRWEKTDEVRLPGSGECPDFFELEIDGDRSRTKWVFWGADGHYLLGRFDGRTFTAESGPHRFYNNGAEQRGSAYAAQTFSDIPNEDGRRIQIAWLQGDFDDMPFNQQMAFPIELSLKTTPDGIRLCCEPIGEVSDIHGMHARVEGGTVTRDLDLHSTIGGELLHLRGSLVVGEDSVFSLVARGLEIEFDCRAGEVRCLERVAPLAFSCSLELEVLIDRGSVEIFAENGRVYMPLHLPWGNAPPSLKLSPREGEIGIGVIDIWRIESCWPESFGL
jgi:sucrose-6-phosphate hydrolase SacC (GH32 family)